MRRRHSGVYNSRERMEEEQSQKRYHQIEPSRLESHIRNLGSFITILHTLCNNPKVHGIDYGCGSHWFVDYVRTDPDYGWNAIGYDPDAAAIDLARKRFPQSATAYQCHNPIRSGLPLESASQDFVFSNAVLQHFDEAELSYATAEMARVLRPGGICMLIFKCWHDDLTSDNSGMDKPPQVLDEKAGKVLFFDPTMIQEIEKLSEEERRELDDQTREGWRLFHIPRIEEVVQPAREHGLPVKEDVPIGGQPEKGIIQYRSGKKMPTACLILTKQTDR